MYAVKKKINGKEYYYAKISSRKDSKVKSKTVAYLGKSPMSKRELEKKMNEIPKSKINNAKKELSEDINKLFFTKKQFTILTNLKHDFKKRLKIKDQKLINDMFDDFKTFYIYNTTAIEGNTISLEETNLLLNENKTPEGKDLKEIYDQINEKKTFNFILKNKIEINNDSIIEIHSMLLKNIDKRIGNFRKHNVRVFGTTFKTTDAKYVKTDMDLLMKWYNKYKKKLHPVILSALFHEKFERIHPFYDGNGRTGRMLSLLILLKNDFPPLLIKNKDRKEYYGCLTQGHKAELFSIDDKNYKKIVDFFFEKIINTYDKIFSKWGFSSWDNPK